VPAVAECNVEKSVGAESDVAGLVPLIRLWDLHDDSPRLGDRPAKILGGPVLLEDGGVIVVRGRPLPSLCAVPDEVPSVGFELRMERQPDESGFPVLPLDEVVGDVENWLRSHARVVLNVERAELVGDEAHITIGSLALGSGQIPDGDGLRHAGRDRFEGDGRAVLLDRTLLSRRGWQIRGGLEGDFYGRGCPGRCGTRSRRG